MIISGQCQLARKSCSSGDEPTNPLPSETAAGIHQMGCGKGLVSR